MSICSTWEQLADAYTGVAKVDCTQHKEVCSAQGVRGYPTLKLFKDGSEVEKYSGARSFDALSSYLEKNGAAKASGSDEL